MPAAPEATQKVVPSSSNRSCVDFLIDCRCSIDCPKKKLQGKKKERYSNPTDLKRRLVVFVFLKSGFPMLEFNCLVTVIEYNAIVQL